LSLALLVQAGFEELGADGEGDGHGENAVVMGAGARASGAIGQADETAALGQEAAAHKALGLVNERGVEASENGGAADGGGEPARLGVLRKNARVVAGGFGECEDAAAVVVAFDDQPGLVVFGGEGAYEAGELQAAEVGGELGALQPGLQFDNLRGGVVAFAAATSRINGDEIVLARDGRKPDLELAIATSFDGRRRSGEAQFDGGELKDGIAAGEKAGFGIFGVLLAGEAAEVSANLTSKANPRKVEALALFQFSLLIGEGGRVDGLGAIAGFHPPREEMADEAGFRRFLPLLVETTADAVGRGFENEFAGWCECGAQAGEGFGGVAGPAGKLRAVEILDGEAAAGVAVAGGGDQVLRVERGKGEEADVGLRGTQGAGAKRRWEAADEAMNDTKDGLSGFLRVRDLERERTGLGDGAEKETRGGPCGEAHLARLKDDVMGAAALLKCALDRIGDERRGAAVASAHTKERGNERFRDRASAKCDRPAIENAAEALEFVAVEIGDTQKGRLRGLGRSTSGVFQAEESFLKKSLEDHESQKRPRRQRSQTDETGLTHDAAVSKWIRKDRFSSYSFPESELPHGVTTQLIWQIALTEGAAVVVNVTLLAVTVGAA
jgi:hypothetical protein